MTHDMKNGKHLTIAKQNMKEVQTAWKQLVGKQMTHDMKNGKHLTIAK